jgi:hypothetical protein
VIADSRHRNGRAAFYCVSSGEYFLGAVGMVNSLRLVGHTEPIFLLDCGLTAAQRALLAPQVTVVPAPSAAPPFMLKTVAPRRHPADVAILIDVDMIVTRPLTDLIDRASKGRVVAFRNNVDRFVPEWGELLDLGTIRRQPYLSSGLVAMGRSPGGEILRLLEDRQRRVELELTYFAANLPDYHFLYVDQDVLNAILASRVERDRVVALDHRLSATIPYEGLRVADEAALRCAYADGTEPYVVHHILPAKPWLQPGHDSVYSRLLRRVLGGSDVVIKVPPRDIPMRLRSGPLAIAERQRVNLREQLRWRFGRLAQVVGRREAEGM